MEGEEILPGGGGVLAGFPKPRCLPVLFLHIPEDLPQIQLPILNHLADLTVILDFFSSSFLSTTSFNYDYSSASMY